MSAAANGEYRVQLPALQSAQPVPLLKYITSPRWRPVPVLVEASLGEAGGSGAGASVAGRGVRVHATVEANPQLKTPLQNVSLSLQPSLASDVERCEPSPPGTFGLGSGLGLGLGLGLALTRTRTLTLPSP